MTGGEWAGGSIEARGEDVGELTAHLDALAAATGFGIASLSVPRAVGETTIVAVGGPQAPPELVGRVTPLGEVEEILRRGRPWDRLLFLPEDEAVEVVADIWTADEPTRDLADDPGAWHPYDLLVLPVEDDGVNLGLVWFDLPIDGRRPEGETRSRMAASALLAARPLARAIRNQRLLERARLAQGTAQLVRRANEQLDLDRALDEVTSTLRRLLRVDEVDVRVAGHPRGPDPLVGLDPRLPEIVDRAAERCWQRGVACAIGPRTQSSDIIDSREFAIVRAAFAPAGPATGMLAPIGAGPDCFGRIVVGRTTSDRDWTDEEVAALREMGEELGRVVLTARAYAREQEASAYRGRLVAAVGRELRQPIGSMLGHLGDLQEAAMGRPGGSGGVGDGDGSGDGEVVDPHLTGAVARVARATQRLSGVVTDLISLALVDDADRALPDRLVDLREACHAAVELLSIRAARAGIALVEEYRGDLWTTGDAAEIERVMINLVGNAVKYSEAGGTVRVAARAETATAEAVVEIVDDGIGISPEDRDRLFTEFFRTDNPQARSREGTGLGLVIAARIIARHGGRVEVESELGSGSTFRVRLPLTPPSAAPAS